MYRTATVMSGSVLALALAVMPAQAGGKTLEEAAVAARALMTAQEYANAESLLVGALEPGHAEATPAARLDALSLLGLSRAAQGKDLEAVEAYRDRVELTEKFFGNDSLSSRRARESLAQAYDRAGMRENARQIWRDLLNFSRLDGNDYEAGVGLTRLARSHWLDGHKSDAERYYSQALVLLTLEDYKAARFAALSGYAEVLEDLGESARASQARTEAESIRRELEATGREELKFFPLGDAQ